jgi:hypothetical protein
VSYRYADIFGINTYKFTQPVCTHSKPAQSPHG